MMKIDEVLTADPEKFRKLKEQQMSEAVKILDFETAALIRDELLVFEEKNRVLDRKLSKKVVK